MQELLHAGLGASSAQQAAFHSVVRQWGSCRGAAAGCAHAGRLQQPLGGDVAVLQRLRGQQRRGGAQRLLQATAAHVACHLLHHCSMGCQGGGVG